MNVDGPRAQQLVDAAVEGRLTMQALGLQQRAVLDCGYPSSVAAAAERECEEPSRDEDGAVSPGPADDVGEAPRMPEGSSASLQPELVERDVRLSEPLGKRFRPGDDDNLRVHTGFPEYRGERGCECLRSSDRAAPEDEGQAQGSGGAMVAPSIHPDATPVGSRRVIRWVLSHAYR